MQLAHFFRDAGLGADETFDHTHSKTTQPCDVFWTMPSANARAILVEIPVDNVVATVLYGPVPAIGGQHLSWLSLFGRLTGDAKGVLDGGDATFFVHHLALDHKNLADMREIKVVVERRAAPDAPCLEASVISRADILMVWCCAVLKQQRDVLFKSLLVAFDAEVVMRAALNQIAGQFALRQQGVCGDGLALNLNGIEYGNKHPDLVGLLDLILALYRQGANFFWV